LRVREDSPGLMFVDAVSNAHLALPAAAPIVGSYSGSLPVAMSAAPSAAGQYTIEADVANRATEQQPANSTAGSVSNVNFGF
ncbi:hypothetical protein NX871_29310, partial [Burkholderia thailandensis]|nr:hypothetical protein [Burkholderia thailandensis]